MKYLGWYILSGNAFHISLHYMRVRFYQCFNSSFARGSNFSEPVLQHLVISAKWTEWTWRIYCFYFCVCVHPSVCLWALSI